MIPNFIHLNVISFDRGILLIEGFTSLVDSLHDDMHALEVVIKNNNIYGARRR